MKPNYLKTVVATMLLLMCSMSGHAYLIDDVEYADLFEEDGIYYVITSTDDMTCAVYHSPYVDGAIIPYSGDIVIPSFVTYEGQKYTVTSIGLGAFCSSAEVTSVSIPNTVTSIGPSAFAVCRGLTSITIPNSVTSIDDEAFYFCDGLTSINIPSSVTSIGDKAFLDCSGLTSITVDADNKYYDSREDCNSLINTSTNELLLGSSNSTIPSTVTRIGDFAFDWTHIKSINIPNSVKSIGIDAFDCSSLTSVTISNSVTSIGDGAFRDCTLLKSLTIPNSVTEIGKYAFGYCSKLTYLSLPSSLASIAYDVISNCKCLSYVTVNNPNVITVPSDFDIGTGTSRSTTDFSSCTLYVPAESVDAYKAATGWKQFGTIMAIPSTADYSIYTKDFTACPGKQVKLSVQMNNANPVCDWQADMELPTGFTLAQDNDGNDPVCMTTDRTTEENHSIITKTQTDGSIRILEASASNALFEGTNGKVASITLNVADDVNEGEYYVKFKNVVLSEPSASHNAGTAICKVNVKNYTIGDVNNDASLNVSDLAQVVNFIMEKPTSDGSIDAAADVNGDGDINGVDYVAEVNAIMNYSYGAKACNVINNNAIAAGYISSANVIMGKGANGIMNISLNGSNNKCTLIQFDITLPEGIRVAEDGAYICGVNSANHEIAIERIGNNTYRIMMYSASLAKIMEDNNGVVSLSLVADKDIAEGTYNATITGQLVVDANGNYNKSKSSSAQIIISDATAINEIANNADNDADVYSADGKLVHKSASNGLAKGMYICGGKKVIVK